MAIGYQVNGVDLDNLVESVLYKEHDPNYPYFEQYIHGISSIKYNYMVYNSSYAWWDKYSLLNLFEDVSGPTSEESDSNYLIKLGYVPRYSTYISSNKLYDASTVGTYTIYRNSGGNGAYVIQNPSGGVRTLIASDFRIGVIPDRIGLLFCGGGGGGAGTSMSVGFGGGGGGIYCIVLCLPKGKSSGYAELELGSGGSAGTIGYAGGNGSMSTLTMHDLDNNDTFYFYAFGGKGGSCGTAGSGTGGAASPDKGIHFGYLAKQVCGIKGGNANDTDSGYSTLSAKLGLTPYENSTTDYLYSNSGIRGYDNYKSGGGGYSIGVGGDGGYVSGSTTKSAGNGTNGSGGGGGSLYSSGGKGGDGYMMLFY